MASHAEDGTFGDCGSNADIADDEGPDDDAGNTSNNDEYGRKRWNAANGLRDVHGNRSRH
ncbi:hypothetical protein URH17368_0778 [Alicyclobacillus hesperidum URH17-3-68]|nr:hypothetical protein URH17368_0778 [Alicyclobacillus hesperidum URH17-3-68]